MGSMFSSPRVPTPQPLPPSPLQDEAQRRAREQEADEATVAAAQSGRRTTMFAGREIALEKQMARARKRGAAAEDIGAL
jgi:hypothetical protein